MRPFTSKRIYSIACLVFLVSFSAFATEKLTAPQLIELAKSKGTGLRDAITASFTDKDLKEGTAWSGRGPDFFFATEAAAKPALFIDGAAGPQMQKLADSNLWYASAHVEPVGKLHAFYYQVNGARFGGRLDMPAFGPLSYLQAGVPSGTLSEKPTEPSKIYHGLKSEY